MGCLERAHVLHVRLILDTTLSFVNGFPLELAILDIENSVSIALEIGIVSHHDASGLMLAINIQQ